MTSAYVLYRHMCSHNINPCHIKYNTTSSLVLSPLPGGFPGAGAPGRAAKIQIEVGLHVSNPKIHQFSKFTKMSKNLENLYFRGHAPDTSRKRDFSKTHSQTQRLHSWIGLDLIKVGKLLPCQLNTLIFRYCHFSDQVTPIFDKPSWSKFPLRLYYS